MNLNMYTKHSEITRKKAKADLVLKNANIVNVFTEEIINADVAISDGIIVGVGTYSGDNEIDVAGKYICPAFIDSHLHLESTLVTPAELIHQAAECGTTTFIVDPHESANVSGCVGIDYILDQTENVPANVYVMAPSCVPATSIDDNGSVLDAAAITHYLHNERILGLGEVMDCPSVINGNPDMHAKIELFVDKIIDGHAPFLDECDLAAYAMAGITTDHECCSYEYAMQERRNGITVLIREGSAAKNLEAIVSGIVENNTDTSGFCFCTDDKHIEEIRKCGHINYNVKKATQLGIPAVKAIKMATIQAARCYGLKHLGAIAPGYQADIIVMDNLLDMQVQEVLHKGRIIQKDVKLDVSQCPKELKNTVHLKSFDRNLLKMPAGNSRIIKMIPGQITTEDIIVELPGNKNFIPNGQYQKIAAIERYRGTGKVGVGAVTGFGIRGGAIASSVSHDSHNIIVIGDNDNDMGMAVDELIRTQGGYTIVENGSVVETLELPIMGLMSDAGYQHVNDTLERMIVKAHSMGIPDNMEPFITLSFMALPVIPQIRITPRGVYSVNESKIIGAFNTMG